MKFIRVFLWGLVGTMTLQGFLHADEYGSAVSLLGGVSLSLAILQETVWVRLQSLLLIGSSGGGGGGDKTMPRALVVSALQESARHPGLHTLPPLRRALADHRRSWAAFRDVEARWMLDHADLIGALRAEGRDYWEHWIHGATAAAAALEAQWCILPSNYEVCSHLQAQLEANTTAAAVWRRVLGMDPDVSVSEWWIATQQTPRDAVTDFIAFHQQLTTLHNVTWPTETRVRRLQTLTGDIAVRVAEGRWPGALVRSLLLRDLWAAGLTHIQRRESRIQEMMVAAGIQDLYNRHDRILAASLRAVPAVDAPTVQNWFDESLNYAWWFAEETPTIVRRCVGQTGGDCRRIGPTEITSLIAQFEERSRIVEDWARCLFIGMWNAMPVVLLLFVFEVVVLLLPRERRVSSAFRIEDEQQQWPRTRPAPVPVCHAIEA